MMDYILHEIEKKIELSDFYETIEKISHYRIWHEYILIALLSNLYNNTRSNLGLTDLDEIIGDLSSGASAGKILSMCSKFNDLDNIFEPGLTSILNEYAHERNEDWGHTLSCEKKDYETFLKKIDDLFQSAKGGNFKFCQTEYNLYKILREENNCYSGICFLQKGEKKPFSFNLINTDIVLKVDNLYALDIKFVSEPQYYTKLRRLSPFIDIDRSGNISIFSKIKKPKSGEVLYQNLFSKDIQPKSRKWEEFISKRPNPNSKLDDTDNGTLINMREKNYVTFIDEIAAVTSQKIQDFLNHVSNNIAVVWGLGGSGKTATVQRICYKLAYEEEENQFSYIVFLTAKRRFYDAKDGSFKEFAIGNVESQNYVSSFDDIQKELCEIFGIPMRGVSNDFCIKDVMEKILLVIDDFESFEKKEADKILEAIKRLDPHYHKIIITTRRQYYSSDYIEAQNLKEDECIFFLKAIHKFTNDELKQLDDPAVRKAITEGTGGYPIVLLHLHEVLNRSDFGSTINKDFVHSTNVFKYIYGNVYECLNKQLYAQSLFCIISLFLKEPTDTDVGILSGSIKDLKFVFNEEENESVEVNFNRALDELKGFRLLNTENGTFTVTTPLIIKLMNERFEETLKLTQDIWISRYKKLSKIAESSIDDYEAQVYPILIQAQKYDEIYKDKNISLENKAVAVKRQVKEQDQFGNDGYDVFKKQAEMFQSSSVYANYTIEWAKYARKTDGHKKEAVEIIQDFFNNVDMDWSQSQLITLKGLYVLYRAKNIQERLSDSYDKGSYIYEDVGKELSEKIEETKMMSWEGQSIHYVCCGLYNVVELLYSEGENTNADKLCDIIINSGNYHFAGLFVNLRKQAPVQNLRQPNQTPITTQRKTAAIPIIPKPIPAAKTAEWNIFITDFPIQAETDAAEFLNDMTEGYTVIEKSIRTNRKDQKVSAMLRLESRVQEFIDEFSLKKVTQHKGSYTYTSYISVCEYNPKGPDYNVNIRNLPKGYSMEEFLELIDGFKPIIVQQPFKTTFSGYPKINATFKEEDVPKIISELNGKKQRGVSIVVSKYEAMAYNFFY